MACSGSPSFELTASGSGDQIPLTVTEIQSKALSLSGPWRTKTLEKSAHPAYLPPANPQVTTQTRLRLGYSKKAQREQRPSL